MTTDVLITCVTTPHTQGEVEVSVSVSGKGRASGLILFTYTMQLSAVSHCSG